MSRQPMRERVAIALGAWAAAGLYAQEPAAPASATPAGLFRPPEVIVDQDGKPLATRRALGHPVPHDVNGDGRCDILLGCHTNMDTTTAEILVLLNVGTPEAPKFRWPAAPVRLEGSDRGYTASCGCKSGGAFEVHPTDWNGDGAFDLVVDTYWSEGVALFLHTATSREQPVFVRGPTLHPIASHGHGSGGGDWNGDGVADFVFPVNRYGWTMYPGVRTKEGGTRFASEPAFRSRDFRLVGQSEWFHHTPYAWNYSGAHGPGSPVAEIVAVMDDPDSGDRPYSQRGSRIQYYWLDRVARTCEWKGPLAENPAAHTRLGIGDLNGDGCMDILFTGGVFTRGEETLIRVLYGRVKNIGHR